MLRERKQRLTYLLSFTIIFFCMLVRSGYSQDKKPNILLILADDLGYTDIGAYGSEISTPNLDTLINEGIHFTNFHVSALCSSTRSMLLTGVDNHLAGLGNLAIWLADNQIGKPGYEGHLNNRVATITELLQDAGYHTYMTGKWHLGVDEGLRPYDRGFSKTYSLAHGSADNFSDLTAWVTHERVVTFSENGELASRPEGVFSTELYTDKLIELIDADRDSGNPFFAYLSFQAVHWPHQAPNEFLEKYQDTYKIGWDKIREARFKRLKEYGFISKDLQETPRSSKVPAWDELLPEQQAQEAARMAAYAGMLENMDFHIGRVIAYLKKTKKYENTIIIFTSDNGPEGLRPEKQLPGKERYLEEYPKTGTEDIGKAGTFSSYGIGWAQVSTTHLSLFKSKAGEGGMRVPLIMTYPPLIEAGQQTHVFSYVTDLAPTILEAAGIEYPITNYKGNKVFPISGKSMVPFLQKKETAIYGPEEAVAYELMGHSAVFLGDYKARRIFLLKKKPTWELFNIIKDPSESHDISKSKPELLRKMIQSYEKYKIENGVIELPPDYSPIKIIKDILKESNAVSTTL